MALLYSAQLKPSKLELLSSWVPSQAWLDGASVSKLEVAGAYRFDDPAGEVGIETHLLRSDDGVIIQVPLTYRGAPVTGAEDWLVGRMEHSVLGPRWVYDGCADPVFANALAIAILTGGHEAALEVETDGHRERREPTTRVHGSGTQAAGVPSEAAVTTHTENATTVINSASWELVLYRRLDHRVVAPTGPRLTGTWPGSPEPRTLAAVVTA
jgi:maltokinase-like protein